MLLKNWGQSFLGLAPFFFGICVPLMSAPAFGMDLWRQESTLERELQGDLLTAWLKLNHYEEVKRGQFKSQIQNSEFFVSASGRVDPIEEFNAFFRVVRANEISEARSETLCRFPARLTLLRRFKLLPDAWHAPMCHVYEDEYRPRAVTSVSIVFASGYFENPASYFGHALLKFNYGAERESEDILDKSVNYGADVTDNESGPIYVIKGLLGGYSASYSENSSLLNTYLYTNGQLRDLWEYRLKLTEEELLFIVEHTWELRNAQFRYFFFNDNCAHRIALLVEMATGRRLSETHGFWLLPIQVIRKLEQTTDHESLVLLEIYHPSLKTIFDRNYSKLEDREKNNLVVFFDELENEQVRLATEFSTPLLLLMLDYLDLEEAKRTIQDEKASKKFELQNERQIVLRELLRRPPALRDVAEPTLKHKVSPLETKQPSLFRLGSGAREGQSVQTVGYRVANNDFLNTPSPGQEISQFIMGELELERSDSSFDISKLVFVNIVNLNTNPLPASLARAYSWGVSVDYSSRSRACSECSDFGLEGRLGKAARINASSLYYALGGGRIHSSSGPKDGYATVTAEVGAIWNVGQLSVLHLRGSAYHDVKSDQTEGVWRLEVAINPDGPFDFRLGVEQLGSKYFAGFSAAYYFD
jgi:hypothetical protein